MTSRNQLPAATIANGEYGGRCYLVRSAEYEDGEVVQFWETEDRTGHIVRYDDSTAEFVRGTLGSAVLHTGFGLTA